MGRLCRQAAEALVMRAPSAIRIKRWTRTSAAAMAVALAVIAFLAIGPMFFDTNAIEKLTTLFIYVILAVMWNALAGYGGLISVGQQAFFGLGAYAALRLANFGLNPYLSLLVGAILVGIVSLPISTFMLRLRAGEFAIGMWVVAELAHLLVNLDGLINGETGTSFIELNRYAAPIRHALIYWSALGAMIGLLAVVFILLRSRVGVSIQAIRDDEDAAESIGVKVLTTKRIVFVLAAAGAALAGALWVASAITFQPKTYFSVQWTAYMIFMVLVGGIGTFEGAIIGAVIFFLIEAWFGAAGVWYLIGLGATALIFALFLPRGIWGVVEERLHLRLLPIGYRVRSPFLAGATSADDGPEHPKPSN
jgi:branched-chain amino acid transport system permease protein